MLSYSLEEQRSKDPNIFLPIYTLIFRIQIHKQGLQNV